MAKKDTKNLILSCAIIVLGLLTILPLFIEQYVGFSVKNPITDKTTTTWAKLFDEGWSEAFKYEVYKGEFFFVLTKIFTIVSLIAGLALAVLAVLKLLNVNLPFAELINKILVITAIIAGALVLISLLIFFISNASDIEPAKIFGGWAWYVGFIAPIGAGVCAYLNK